MKPREGQVQQESHEQQRPETAHPKDAAQLRDRVEAQERGPGAQLGGQGLGEDKEAERQVAESQRGGGERRGVERVEAQEAA